MVFASQGKTLIQNCWQAWAAWASTTLIAESSKAEEHTYEEGDEEGVDEQEKHHPASNPHSDKKVDLILQRLLSPAPQSLFVIERALRQLDSGILSSSENRSRRCVQETLDQCSYLLKKGYHFCIQSRCQHHGFEDYRTIMVHRPGVDWTIRHDQEDSTMEWEDVRPQQVYPSCRVMACEILDYVQTESDNIIQDDVIDSMLDELEDHLNLTLGTDIRGRTAADTAFTVALAGVMWEEAFKKLLSVALLELE